MRDLRKKKGCDALAARAESSELKANRSILMRLLGSTVTKSNGKALFGACVGGWLETPGLCYINVFNHFSVGDE